MRVPPIHGEGANDATRIDLRQIAKATTVVLAVLVAAALAYLLLDILLLLFLGVIVAAALRPWHVMLCRWRVPKGLAVLLIYALFFVGLVLIVIAVGPMLMDQMNLFTSVLPGIYADARTHLLNSTTTPIHMIGARLPPFDRLMQTIPEIAPKLYEGALGMTASIVRLPVYFLTVLALGFYWTMELPRFERLFLSLLAVERRPRALNIWHEIEAKLGGFIRGQARAMLAIGVASAISYALIGLPNVLALAVIAGLLEALPMIGPVLAVIPVLLTALPLGLNTVLMVIGAAASLQLIQNSVVTPRIMNRAVGVSALVGLLAILAFATLYGIVGVLIAIPMTAAVQVLLDTMVVNVEPVGEPAGLVASPWEDLRGRVVALRQQARVRLRTRSSRMGIDPATADHVVDAVDQQIEVAAARVEKLISVAEKSAKPMAVTVQEAIVEKLQNATEEIEQALERDNAVTPPVDNAPGLIRSALGLAAPASKLEETATVLGESAVDRGTLAPIPAQPSPSDATVNNLDRATQRFSDALQDVEILVVAAQAEARAIDATETLDKARNKSKQTG